MMKHRITCTFLLMALTSCSLMPDYVRPTLHLPESWQNATPPSKNQEQNPVSIAKDWWTQFNNFELNRLMELALAQNYSVEAGVQRINQARAALKIAGASLLPSVSVTGEATANQTHDTNATTTSKSYDAGLNVAYELDIFGANRAGISSAEANLKASQFNQEALKLALMGDVAQSYFSLLTLQERLQIADNNLENAREVLRIIHARVDRGSESELQLAQQKSAVASSEAARAQLLQQVQNAKNALAVLTGTAPGQFKVETTSLRKVAIPAVTPAQPSTLLERRPDIRAAEANLMAANADIGAARAAFFPSLSLSAGANTVTNSLSDPATTILSLASSLTAPLFRGGALKGGLEQATAKQKELVADYRQSILTAMQEVEDALVAVQINKQREDALRIAMEQARKAYQLSKLRYNTGAIDFQTLLDTQNTQLAAEDSFSQARLTRLNALIDLYMALGGGWSSALKR